MNKNFGQFTLNSTLNANDNIVGYVNTSANGERRWLYSAVKQDIINSIPVNRIVKAWINFDGTSPVAEYTNMGTGRASYNVTSVIDLGRGRYQINVPFDTTNCVIVATLKQSRAMPQGSGSDAFAFPRPPDLNAFLFNITPENTTLPVTSIGVACTTDSNGDGTVYEDALGVNVIVFGN